MTQPANDTTQPFRDLPSLVAGHARQRPEATALVVGDQRLSYATLDALADRVAATLQREGLQPGERVAVCATSCPAYIAIYLGTLRAGGAVAPLAPSSTAEQLVGMAVDADARRFFLDAGVADALAAAGVQVPASLPVTRLEQLDAWLPPAGTTPCAGGHRPRLAVQPDLFVGHHRHAQGHRAEPWHALGPHPAGGHLGLCGRHRHHHRHAAVQQHHPGQRDPQRWPGAAAWC